MACYVIVVYSTMKRYEYYIYIQQEVLVFSIRDTFEKLFIMALKIIKQYQKLYNRYWTMQNGAKFSQHNLKIKYKWYNVTKLNARLI